MKAIFYYIASVAGMMVFMSYMLAPSGYFLYLAKNAAAHEAWNKSHVTALLALFFLLPFCAFLLLVVFEKPLQPIISPDGYVCAVIITILFPLLSIAAGIALMVFGKSIPIDDLWPQLPSYAIARGATIACVIAGAVFSVWAIKWQPIYIEYGADTQRLSALYQQCAVECNDMARLLARNAHTPVELLKRISADFPDDNMLQESISHHPQMVKAAD